jgi:hypothetical protein
LKKECAHSIKDAQRRVQKELDVVYEQNKNIAQSSYFIAFCAISLL